MANIRGCSVAGCVAAAIIAVVPAAAHAAVPRTGSWDSGSNSEPTVSFQVRGPAARRILRRVSLPERCTGDPEPTGSVWFDVAARVHAGGRIRVSGEGLTLRGRFVTSDRAEVTVRTDEEDVCAGTFHYTVRHTRPRLPVRSGRFLTLVDGGTAGMEFEVSNFGRMAEVQYLSGTVPATCSDGSQRFLSLLGSATLIDAPIRPRGRFDASAPGHPAVRLSGTFDHGSVAALLFVSDVLADGVSCKAGGFRVVGSLAFPYF